MSRWSIVERPLALPGECFLCRSAVGPFIDTGMQWDVYGAVYLGVECLADMARMLGYITPDQAERIAQDAMSVSADLDSVRVQLAELAMVREVLEQYAERRAGDDARAVPADGGGDGSSGGRRGAGRRRGGRPAHGDGGGPLRPAADREVGGEPAGAELAPVEF